MLSHQRPHHSNRFLAISPVERDNDAIGEHAGETSPLPEGGTMVFFKWKESFNVGVEEVDRQHKSFVELLNACYEKVFESHQSKADPGVVARLREYALEHFHFEEELLRFRSYPDMELQQQQHRIFKAKVLELEDAFAEGKEERMENLFAFMKDWFMRHILEEDMKIAGILKRESQETKERTPRRR
jgi:hemerythrin